MVDKEKAPKLVSLLNSVIESDRSDFYTSHFAKHGNTIRVFLDADALGEIPFLTWNDMEKHAFTERIYTIDNLITKIVYHPKTHRPLLIGRTRSDIAREHFGKLSERPLVLFENVYEAIEKGLWYYEHGILPVVNEENMAITTSVSKLYHIDGITADQQKFREFLKGSPSEILQSIAHVNIVDSSFDHLWIRGLSKQWSLSLILGLPEVGTIAHACSHRLKDDELLFHPNEQSIVECDGVLTMTKLIMLPTPIIRYRTDIKAKWVKGGCPCGATQTFALH